MIGFACLVAACLLFLVGWIDLGERRFVRAVLELFFSGMLAAVAWDQPAFAYPENVRQGYPSCAACHVNGSGSGLLTLYGREKAASGLAVWSRPNEGGALHGALDLEKYPSWLLVGGDVRYLNLNVTTPRGKLHRKFLMQAAGELAIRPIPYLWLVTSGGVYGEQQQREWREHYAKLSLGHYVTLRGGRFLPVYGVLFDDHSLVSRQALGFNQGREQNTAEIAVRGKYGEAVAAQTFGDGGTLILGDSDQGYEYGTTTETMTVGKAAAFIGGRAQVGASYLYAIGPEHTDREAWGAFAIVAPLPWLYGMTDVNRQQRTGEVAKVIATTVIGVEPYKGVTVAATHEQVDKEPAYGLQLRLYPRPHFGVLARVKRERETLSSLFALHYYL